MLPMLLRALSTGSAKAARAEPADSDHALDDGRPWAEDIFAVACLRVDGHRLIEHSPTKMLDVAEELGRITQGGGSGSLRVEQVVLDPDSAGHLAEQADAVRSGLDLVMELGAAELADRLRRLQELAMLIDSD